MFGERNKAKFIKTKWIRKAMRGDLPYPDIKM